MAPPNIEVRAPASAAEWDNYFNLRWRILRQPWSQARGSERDNLEESAFHLLALDPTGRVVGGGRLHLNSADEAQVRYMAVEPASQGCGYGSTILRALEAEARRRGVSRMVLNARDKSITFYEGHGYIVLEEAETLFGQVRHVRMQKSVA